MFTQEDVQLFSSNLDKTRALRELAPNLTLIAHRGIGPTSIIGPTFSQDMFPENTIRAFRQAIILGADGIELDIFKSSDNTIMVIHDDELCRNVYGGTNRTTLPIGETESSYRISNKTSHELQSLQVGPLDVDKIPTLSQVFDLAREANIIRAEKAFPPIILNIEIKDETAINCCLQLITSYIETYPNSGVNFDSICFCSFHHKSLITLKQQASDQNIQNIQIAPGIKTATLFGTDNVDSNFRKKKGAKYIESALIELRNLVMNNDFTAYDAVFWDIYEPLITLASLDRKQIHASTSDHRDYNNPREQCQFLLCASKNVPIYFKCDEIGKAKEALYRYSRALAFYDENRSLEEQKTAEQQESVILQRYMEKPTKTIAEVEQAELTNQDDQKNNENNEQPLPPTNIPSTMFYQSANRQENTSKTTSPPTITNNGKVG